jgi:hypothetical protein
MPDAHWGYGFPIGGVGAFDPEAGGVVSAGGVGFDISCGVRTLRTGLSIILVARDQPFSVVEASARCEAQCRTSQPIPASNTEPYCPGVNPK